MLKACTEQARRIIQQRQLCSYMNKTKWQELFCAIRAELPVLPPYQFRFLTTPAQTESDRDFFWWGTWDDEAFPTEAYYFNIEWIRILAVCKMPGKQVCVSAQLDTILNRFNIPYEKENDVYTIYGYK